MKTSKKMLSLLLIAAMLVSVLCMGVSATDYDPVSISEGEPVTISWNGTTGTVVSVDGSSYIPKEFLLWAQVDYSVTVDGEPVSWNIAPGEGDTSASYTIATDATNAITIVATNGTTTYTITRKPAKQIDDNVVYVEKGLAVGNTVTVEAASGALVFINGKAATSYTVTTTAKPVQIVVQNGDAEPYIVVLK